MAILKYKNQDGKTVSINSYKINNVIISQEKGDSTTEVMSQKAVSDEIKAATDEIKEQLNGFNDELGQFASELVDGITALFEENNNANDEKYQPKGDYLTEHQSLEDYALKAELPTNISDLNNDSNFATEEYVDGEISELNKAIGNNTDFEVYIKDYIEHPIFFDNVSSVEEYISVYENTSGLDAENCGNTINLTTPIKANIIVCACSNNNPSELTVNGEVITSFTETLIKQVGAFYIKQIELSEAVEISSITISNVIGFLQNFGNFKSGTVVCFLYKHSIKETVEKLVEKINSLGENSGEIEVYTKAELNEMFVRKPKIYKMYFPKSETEVLQDYHLEAAAKLNIHMDTTYTEMLQLVEDGYIIEPYYYGDYDWETCFNHSKFGFNNYIVGVRDFHTHFMMSEGYDYHLMDYDIYDFGYNKINYTPLRTSELSNSDIWKKVNDRIILIGNPDLVAQNGISIFSKQD